KAAPAIAAPPFRTWRRLVRADAGFVDLLDIFTSLRSVHWVTAGRYCTCPGIVRLAQAAVFTSENRNSCRPRPGCLHAPAARLQGPAGETGPCLVPVMLPRSRNSSPPRRREYSC